jgi:hypothetical protein
MFRFAALLAVFCGTLAANFALAQPGSFFGDGAPRPPANVPNGTLPPQPPPPQFQGQQYQGQQFQGQSNLGPPLPSGPPPSGVQAQPLPPPPGAASPPQQNQAQRPRGAPPPAGAAAQPANNAPPQQPADTAPPPPPDDTIVTEMPTQKIENTRAVFAGLDKITGRIISFDAAIGETVQFGALQVTARVCYTRPPTEATNTDAFVQVDEVTLQGEIKRIFNGWMFAASPGLHGVEHPIYDVWLTDCAAPAQAAEPVMQPTPASATTPAARPPRARQAMPRAQTAQPLAPAPPPAAPPQPR